MDGFASFPFQPVPAFLTFPFLNHFWKGHSYPHADHFMTFTVRRDAGIMEGMYHSQLVHW